MQRRAAQRHCVALTSPRAAAQIQPRRREAAPGLQGLTPAPG
jgi:hypothetical protein